MEEEVEEGGGRCRRVEEVVEEGGGRWRKVEEGGERWRKVEEGGGRFFSSTTTESHDNDGRKMRSKKLRNGTNTVIRGFWFQFGAGTHEHTVEMSRSKKTRSTILW